MLQVSIVTVFLLIVLSSVVGILSCLAHLVLGAVLDSAVCAPAVMWTVLG